MAKGGKGRKGGGGGGGKTRKYSRDNKGRFASTGSGGATARGGRLLTAKGNKRTARALAGKTKTIEAAGQKGVLAKPKGLKPGSIKPKAAAATKPVAKKSRFTPSESAERKQRATELKAIPKKTRQAERIGRVARRQIEKSGGVGVGIIGKGKPSSQQYSNSLAEGALRLKRDKNGTVGKSMQNTANKLRGRMATTGASPRTGAQGGAKVKRITAAKPKGVITKAKSKPVAAAKPKTQKERWAARAKMLNNAADKNDAKAKRLRDANDTTGNTAFNTQPGKIPGRARMNAASERSFRMNEKAQQQRTRAENLQRMATTNKGDAAKGRAARAEQVKASYGGIKKGTIVESIMGGGGAATVVRANAKSVTIKMSDGRVMNQPYEALKLKPATLGSSKVVDSAKVNRMAGRLGAKARAPKSSSPVKNANTVATRAKALAFLKGKGGTFPNAAAVRESIAANIRNRQVFSTGKKAAPKAAKAPTKKPKTELQTLQQADRLMGKLAKRQASIKVDKVGLDEGLRQVRRNNSRAVSVNRALDNRGLLSKYQKLTAPADAIRMTPAGKGIPQPKAAKPAAAAAPKTKKARTDESAFGDRYKRAGKVGLKRSIKESDNLNNPTGKATFEKRFAATQQRQSQADRTAAAAKDFYRRFGSPMSFAQRPKLSTAGGARFGVKKKPARKPRPMR